MEHADDEEREPEQHRVVAERAGHREGDDEHRRHRGEHRPAGRRPHRRSSVLVSQA